MNKPKWEYMWVEVCISSDDGCNQRIMKHRVTGVFKDRHKILKEIADKAIEVADE